MDQAIYPHTIQLTQIHHQKTQSNNVIIIFLPNAIIINLLIIS
jgi:hypothetical protein